MSAQIAGLHGNTTYHYRIVAGNPSGTSNGGDETLKTAPNAPTVLTTAATSVGQVEATLNASVDPEGAAVSECRFDYGPTEAYGASVACASPPGSGESPVAVSAHISGLHAGTTYNYRIVAGNPSGTSNGSDDPEGAEVSECRFDYGATTAYGASAPCQSLPGSGNSAVPVSAHISSLSSSATFHFRIVAVDPGGTSYGGDEAFTTTAAPLIAPIEALPSHQGAAPPEGAQKGVLPFTEQLLLAPVARLLSSSLTASRSGAVKIRLGCVSQRACIGTVTLRTIAAVRAARTSQGRARILTLAVGSFNVLGGRETSLAVSLSAQARKLLHRMRALRVRVGIACHAPTGPTHAAQTIVSLRLAAAAR